jgi:hypothetical protein
LLAFVAGRNKRRAPPEQRGIGSHRQRFPATVEQELKTFHA